jgi:peptide/nickel transport system substrate-binding protein
LLAATGATAVGAIVLAACGGGDGGAGDDADSSGLVTRSVNTTREAKRGGVLKLSHTADVPHFDPHALAAPLSTLTPMMYSRLLQVRPGELKPPDGTVEPDGAESFEYSPDRTQLTFKLRPNLYFHNTPPVNGRAVDAQDVVFSYERTAQVGILRSSLVNAVDPNAPVLSVTAPDSRTVVVKIKKPLVYIEELLSNHRGLGIVPKEAASAYDPRRTPIGSGAFMLTKYEPSVGFEYTRHERHYDQPRPFVDKLELPIITEYASGLSQFRAGNMFWYTALRAQDLLPLKRDLPQIEVHATDVVTNGQHTLFGQLPGKDGQKSPFLDERVRQAYSMALNRDLWIDVVYDTDTFRSQGLPVDTRWNTALPGSTDEGWWLDPKSKDFGPNAKYYEHNVAESKKLLAAAGYANGVEIQSHVVSSGLGVDFAKLVEILEGFAAEAGFKLTPNLIDYNTDYVPNYRDSSGRFSGISYRSLGASPVTAAVGELLDYRTGAFRWYGFDVNGRGDFSGDPHVDREVDKALAEFDFEKRRGIVHEMQRYLAQRQYGLRHPGGASGFDLAWPALQNFNVFRGGGQELRVRATTWWLDPTKPPLA